MNRELYGTPQSPHMRYMQNQPSSQVSYNDYGLSINQGEMKKSSEISDLVIFNGQAPEKDLLTNSTSKIQYAQLPPKNKSTSQKKLPVIYSTAKDSYGGAVSPRDRNSIEQHYSRQGKDLLESNNSEVFQYTQMFPQNNIENQLDSNGFHTFKCIPPESNPQTAKFIPPSEHNRENSRGKEHQMQYLSVPGQQSYQPFQQLESSSPRPQSRAGTSVSFSSGPQVPLSPRNNYQNRQYVPSSSGNNVKLIQIPQDQYQKFIDHLPICKKSQDQITRLRQNNEELGQKQKFYWEENMTLREQNKRLRDLVSHFQKRQKELQKSRDESKQTYERTIDNYRDAAMEEVSLLFERYRLELQKGK